MAKTKPKPTQFYENKNTADILTRLVILGLLRILNQKLIYTQVWDTQSEEGTETVTVPFFFDFTGGSVASERFIQDNYLNWTDDECTMAGIKKIDGDFKPIPFGVITLNGTSIDSGNISNRFVMGRYSRKEKDGVKSYVSFLYSIPLTMNFQAAIKCDNMNTMWKIEQAFREFFYKNKTYHINYKGMSVPVRVGFPESTGEEKTNQYTMGQQNDGADIKLTFDLTCETYQPVFDPLNERPADQMIRTMSFGVDTHSGQQLPTVKSSIIPTTDLTGSVIGIGQDVILEWRNYYETADLTYVDLLYKVHGDSDWTLIDTVPNHNFYHWIVPEELVSMPPEFDFIVQGTDDIVIHTLPALRIYPDPKSGLIDETTVVVLSKGMFFTEYNEVTLPFTLSYVDDNGNIHDIPAEFNILNGMLNEDRPLIMDPVMYLRKSSNTKIELMVRDHQKYDSSALFIKDDSNINNWITVC